MERCLSFKSSAGCGRSSLSAPSKCQFLCLVQPELGYTKSVTLQEFSQPKGKNQRNYPSNQLRKRLQWKWINVLLLQNEKWDGCESGWRKDKPQSSAQCRASLSPRHTLVCTVTSSDKGNVAEEPRDTARHSLLLSSCRDSNSGVCHLSDSRASFFSPKRYRNSCLARLVFNPPAAGCNTDTKFTVSSWCGAKCSFYS